MKIIWLLILLPLLPVAANGQEPRFIQHEIGDEHIGIAINAMLQDHQCMIWIGTDKGLFRYDGLRLNPFVLDSSKQMAAITSLAEDTGGNIWVGSSTGRIYRIGIMRKPISFIPEEGFPRQSVTSILQDQNGYLWFATYGEGVYVYTHERLFNIGMDDGLTGNDIYSMIATPSGEVWLATDDGINICTFRNEEKKIRHLGRKDGLPDQIITTLKADPEGNVWIGTFEQGVVYYDALSDNIKTPLKSSMPDRITALELFDGSELWIGTAKAGVWRFHKNGGFLRKLKGLENFRQMEISSLMADVEGNVWIACEDGRLLSAFRPFETVPTDIQEIQTLFCDHNDKLWIGSRQGLYVLEEKQDAFSSARRIAEGGHLNITDIVEDKFFNLWIGTIDNGLFIYRHGAQSLTHIKARQLIDNTIMSMAVGDDKIWISTLQGVMSYPAGKNILTEKSQLFDLISDPWQSHLHFVFQVFVDSKNRAWFATDGNGVYSIENGKVTSHTGDEDVSIRTVYSIAEDQRGHLWFNTSDQGLVEFDGARYRPLVVADGLGNVNIASLLSSGTGDLIMAHSRGIDVMEPDRRHFMYYGAETGVKEIEPALNSIASDSKGHVYISGRNLIVKYYSAEHELSIHPCTQITGVSVYDQPVDFTSKNKFPHGDNYISFDYVGLWYTAPRSVNFLYRLDGYDRQWKESRDNTASYSDLRPGEYTFLVKASENRSFLDEPLASYSFTIAKPFWHTYWFISSLVVAGVILFYWIVKSRERRSERQALAKKEMIETQFQALKAQINPHFLFNSFNTLITIIDENSDKPGVAIEYVEKLSDFFRSILQYREQESISLEEEWELVQNFGYLLKKRYGENLRLHMGSPPADAFILPLTLQMLVENAVKHNVITEQKPLDVYITADNDYVTVKNNLQPKSRSEPSTQFGLQSIMRRYSLLGEQKVVIEKDDRFFVVRIPIKKRNT